MTDSTASHDDPLDAVIADYLQQVEVGAVPDREALLAAHPELAERLRDFFADYDRLDRQAAELRLWDDPNRTADRPERPGDPPRVRYFGDYELLEVIARGGMGVVYKARQVSLNRLVALKMILHARLATPRDVARFRAKAEAGANLDHPNIVPIYEVGEHDGRQYYAMRFVEGTSLAGHPRGAVRTEVQLVAMVARAVHFAHQRGLLHRDIKPSNVLIAGTGSSAVPLITDFGLAKRLGAAGDLTATGEVLGTPRYMAPEQAAGRKDLTVAVDVYSLGVLLYERLTGATPFTGDSLVELARQHREDAPPPPSSVRPGLSRDLETICLKCLEKEPAKRYASAEALADDLERWLRGEPILARPVGSVGRFTRWCRRNPLVTGLTGAIAASLVAGTAIATYFAVEANQRAAAERTERLHAQAAEDDLERALARSMVRPLLPSPLSLDPPNDAEIDALWDLAGSQSERLRLRVLEEAPRTPVTAGQIGNRAEWAMLAVVGLDPRRRERAERLLVEQMRTPEKGRRHKTEIAWAVLRLTEKGSPIRRECSEAIALGLSKESRSGDLSTNWTRRIIGQAEWVEGAPRLLIQRLENPTGTRQPPDQSGLRSQLTTVAQRLEPAEGAWLLVQAIEVDPGNLVEQNAQALATVARRLEPAEATRTLATAAQSLSKAMETRKADQLVLSKSLAAVADALEPAEAARIYATASRLQLEAVEKEKNTITLGRMAESLPGVFAHLGPAEGARASATGARLLANALGKKEILPSLARKQIATSLVALVGRLEAAEAAGICTPTARLLAQALEEQGATNNATTVKQVGRPQELAAVGQVSQLRELAGCLATIAQGLEPAEAARVCTPAAQMLKEALEKVQPPQHPMLTEALMAPADRLEPAVAVRLLVPALEKEPHPISRGHLAVAVATAAGRLGPAEAAPTCATVAQLLIEGMEKGPADPDELAAGIAAAVAWLEPHEAGRVCTTAVRLLSQALETNPENDEFLRHSMVLLAVLGQHLDRDVALRSAQTFTRRIAMGGWKKQTGAIGTWQEMILLTSFECFLTDTARLQVQQRAAAAAAENAAARLLTTALGAVRTGQGSSRVGALTLWPAAGEPLPCRLPTQDLVELLKYPTCVGEMRHIILKHLSNRYHRRFATHWDFVRYAQEHNLNLDFTTPPKRPDPKLPPLFDR